MVNKKNMDSRQVFHAIVWPFVAVDFSEFESGFFTIIFKSNLLELVAR
jgi:hypothetical protein